MFTGPERRLFGTDGVRGVAGRELTAELCLAVASASVQVLAAGHPGRPLAVVGHDPRPSGDMLEAATVAGLAAAGADVVRVGVLPTPAVAFLAGRYRADLAIMLSASHNPMPDNGIKVFAAGGRKLSDDRERAIEASVVAAQPQRCTGERVGRVRDGGATAAEDYLRHLSAASPISLAGLRVVVDCANGAASQVAPEAYRRAGADVVAIGADMTGRINDGVGSTHLEHVAAAVVDAGADLGIAHDGDADRCLAVAADGSVVDGDQILAICALALQASGQLVDNTVVATVMSNLGFHRAMRKAGIEVVTAAVGDRYVLAELLDRGLSLGGEQSGHLVFMDAATTGDGLLTALRLMGAMVTAARPLSELAAVVQRLPQVLLNVRVADRDAVAASQEVSRALANAEAQLGQDGRILLRASGTEPLVRIMVEAPSDAQASRIANHVAEVVASV